MNKFILDIEVQDYINAHLNADVHKIAMGKSPFQNVTAQELSTQITAKKKSEKKLLTWYHHHGIYYPEPLSVEQSSSEKTADYKAGLILKGNLIDLTGGFGVDCYYFSKKASAVVHCEINEELSLIAAANTKALGVKNITFFHGDGLAYLKNTATKYNTIYIDPARRSDMRKVFMLKDCTPNVIENLNLLLTKASRVIIKTSPLLDLTAGLKELSQVAEIHIVSVKNECKELLFVLEKNFSGPVNIICTTLNEKVKQFSFTKEQKTASNLAGDLLEYIYEPDVALLKSGEFSLIGNKYGLLKLQEQTQLYTSNEFKEEFPGRIFKVEKTISAGDLKRSKDLYANVVVRNYPDKAENLVKKYKIKPGKDNFLLFTQTNHAGLIIIKASILQYY